MHTTIIAEAGVNHNGSLEIAMELIKIAKEASADVVKFQTFTADSLVTTNAPRAVYQQANTQNSGSQHSLLKGLELSKEAYIKLSRYCESLEIEFLSTAFDIECLKFLVNETGIRRIKIPSGEITNGPYILEAARTKLPVILSTGMATIGEIEDALKVLAYGYCVPQGNPTKNDLLAAYQSTASQLELSKKVTILQCGTNYPLPPEDVNLRAMIAMGSMFNVATGLSDHTEGISISIAAAALGATVIEKHFTKDRKLPGPDHKASIEPCELTMLVHSIRQVEKSLGLGVKILSPTELENRRIVRKSLVASRPLKKGHSLSFDDIAAKRPATGYSPMSYWDMLGKRLSRDYEVDEAFEE